MGNWGDRYLISELQLLYSPTELGFGGDREAVVGRWRCRSHGG
ncbi:hypothetical protein QT970_17635 [Microcoleus sp. herbarium8]